MTPRILTAVLCGVLAAAGPSAAAATPRLVTFSNGLQALLAPDSLASAAAVDVWFEGGSRTDPPEAPGITYLLSRTALLLPQAQRRAFEALGAAFGAAATSDYAVITARLPAELVERVL